INHMIGEYSRHNGHADLLRERVDGKTGDFPPDVSGRHLPPGATIDPRFRRPGVASRPNALQSLMGTR
ncbi:hypothetical protein B2A_04017, partial [mine drainage metagenome]